MSERHDAGDDAGRNEFAIRRIYVKDLSFESPMAPGIFTADWTPDVEVHVQSAANAASDEDYEVTLTITVTAKVADGTAFIAEVQQAGLFTVRGFEAEDLAKTLGAFCPTVLFPYGREAITDLAVRGGFPQLLLAPVNFDALYDQQRSGAESEPVT